MPLFLLVDTSSLFQDFVYLSSGYFITFNHSLKYSSYILFCMLLTVTFLSIYSFVFLLVNKKTPSPELLSKNSALNAPSGIRTLDK